MAQIQRGTTYVREFLLVSTSDHITGKTAAAPVVTLSKAGAAFAAPTGAVAEIGNGFYSLSYSVADTSALGDLGVHITGTGADPTDLVDQIVGYNPGAAGSGGLTVTLTIQNDITHPVANAAVWVSTDSQGTNVVASGTSDAFGHVTVYLSAGTYNVFASKTGEVFTNPVVINVS